MKLRIFILLLATASAALAQSTINATDHFAYGANVGWCDFRPSITGGAVMGEFVCSGSLYAANLGWISLGSGSPANQSQYKNNTATDYGVNLQPGGLLRGYAYSANVGWIAFEPTGNPRVDLTTGNLLGYAYGANIGWLDLATLRTDTLQPGADTDTDGIADAWEITRAGNLATLTATGDADGDGISDRDEYFADTHPLLAQDALRITGFGQSGSGFVATLKWTSRSTRNYRIEVIDNLASGLWVDSGLGIIPADGDSETGRGFNGTPNPQRFYRVRAMRPLIP